MIKLNLGCGGDIQSGMVNVDWVKAPGVDVVHDFDDWPWPFEDGAAAEILAQDVFEHVPNPILFMTECHRILRAAGELFIRSPFWRAEQAYTDPTHRRFCTQHSWDYWIPGTLLYKHNPFYGGVSFTKHRIDLLDGNLFVHLIKA